MLEVIATATERNIFGVKFREDDRGEFIEFIKAGSPRKARVSVPKQTHLQGETQDLWGGEVKRLLNNTVEYLMN
jgi:hypothetical protein